MVEGIPLLSPQKRAEQTLWCPRVWEEADCMGSWGFSQKWLSRSPARDGEKEMERASRERLEVPG